MVFGGSAFLQLPLTSDHAAFGRFLDAASTDDLANPGTDLSRALSAAATTFEHEGQRGFQTAVLLVSDGESVEGDAGPAIKRLRDAGVPVFAVGVGTEGRGTHPGRQRRRRRRSGIGTTSAGWCSLASRKATSAGSRGRPTASICDGGPGSGATLAAELEKLEKRTLSSRPSPERADRFQWPLGFAVLLLGLEPLIGIAPRRRRE